MKITKDDIRCSLSKIACPNGECIEVVQKVVKILLGTDAKLMESKFCTGVDTAKDVIKMFLADNALVVMYPSCGFDEKGISVFHSYIVYSAMPLESLSIWDHGLQFYNESDTVATIHKTIISERHNKQIEI